jgi:hypothetical protein
VVKATVHLDTVKFPIEFGLSVAYEGGYVFDFTKITSYGIEKNIFTLHIPLELHKLMTSLF